MVGDYNGKFPTDFKVYAYVKRVLPKVTRTVIASMLVDMLKSVLGNTTVPFMATDTMRTLAYRGILDALIEDSAMPRGSNLALRAMEPLFWRRGEKKDLALFGDFVSALERYVKHAQQDLERD
ncbi:hypothetical protein AMAG_17980 [Allomyces macrogynus ATCC 38327]|uniref:Uncharacterized protein n=1 Tax=Allomyces macrogynus (strain ATCC 38327) TaxID=578462 RepID=A0A0L0S3E3_ALLM3|nr:hypothetical protein AMAG_17980 [Allomyces macrogynus ATCC 38327]|eukprot:KNE56904.1 hypothetical protein AMAG_17980 [Allomyces macrogynus ATCC 38327]